MTRRLEAYWARVNDQYNSDSRISGVANAAACVAVLSVFALLCAGSAQNEWLAKAAYTTMELAGIVLAVTAFGKPAWDHFRQR